MKKKRKVIIVCVTTIHIPDEWLFKYPLGKGRNVNLYVIKDAEDLYYWKQLDFYANKHPELRFKLTPDIQHLEPSSMRMRRIRKS